MRNKIQKSMLMIIYVTIVSTFLLLAVLFYAYSTNLMKDELKQEMKYLVAAVENAGYDYLIDMDMAQAETRVSMIAPDGNVLYDSKENDYDLENHSERKEVRDAMKYGTGDDIRYSKTIGKRSYYYAFRLKDGNILRASKSFDSMFSTILIVFAFLLCLAVAMVVFAYMLAKRQTKKLIQPINELDLEHPLDHVIYEELTPLLQNIDSQNKSKEEVATMRKEFSANVSHELKTPLTSISGYAEIMKSGMVEQADMIRFSEKIHKESNRMISMIEDIIKLSKLDEQQSVLDKETVDLYTLCCDVKNRLQFAAEKKNVQIELNGDHTLYFGVYQILEEMIYNIIDNAIKYNVVGGKVRIWVGKADGRVKVSVEDTGIGIPHDQQERIFERFYRVDKSHSKAIGGTGLGLSIVKHGALYHKAEVRVNSEAGRGTKMELVFA